MQKKRAWIISVDMGYGHNRAANPLRDIAYKRIITVNSDKVISSKDKKRLRNFQTIYEGVSRLRSIPLFGELLWKSYDRLQSISPFYPFRDLSKPNLGSIYMHVLIKQKFLNSVVEYTKRNEIPFVTTFYATALAAAHTKLKDIYCVVTDTDINRVWVPEYPKRNKIYYLAPTERVVRRLLSYGINKEHVFFTGFPLPKENLGDDLRILKSDIGNRLPNLDPKKIFIERYKATIKKELGKNFKNKSDHIITLTYAIGGAGAQKDIGIKLLNSLKDKIRSRKIKVNIIVGTKLQMEQKYLKIIDNLGLNRCLGEEINVFGALGQGSYFEGFNKILRTTDVLWSKPSELSFFVGLGIPMLISPPLGAQEIQNQKWLIRMGAGVVQDKPEYCNEWLFDYIDRGILAEAAWAGYFAAPKFGTYNIEKVLFSKNKENLKFGY